MDDDAGHLGCCALRRRNAVFGQLLAVCGDGCEMGLLIVVIDMQIDTAEIEPGFLIAHGMGHAL